MWLALSRSELLATTSPLMVRRLPFQMLDGSQAGSRPLLAKLARPGDELSFAQPEFLNQRRRDIGIGRLGHVLPGRVAQEAEALGVKFKNALNGLRVLHEFVNHTLR